ncbi:Hpt domain-containing protein [Falsiroseomonas oryziterrae]|uniref:Hpt domain-containing protein n=1 Tax=Falsiroseomonas oryziterrae TaxID=2911368 RepID=UPI001F0168A3|nr:Hpt domain-containing protein [Roseomonas sp. NPKOSM-4]
MSAVDLSPLRDLVDALPREQFAAILRTFNEDLARLTREYEAAATPEAARRAAHAVAGTAAGIGARALEAAARRAMDPGSEDPRILRAALRQEADIALAELARLVEAA